MRNSTHPNSQLFRINEPKLSHLQNINIENRSIKGREFTTIVQTEWNLDQNQILQQSIYLYLGLRIICSLEVLYVPEVLEEFMLAISLSSQGACILKWIWLVPGILREEPGRDAHCMCGQKHSVMFPFYRILGLRTPQCKQWHICPRPFIISRSQSIAHFPGNNIFRVFPKKLTQFIFPLDWLTSRSFFTDSYFSILSHWNVVAPRYNRWYLSQMSHNFVNTVRALPYFSGNISRFNPKLQQSVFLAAHTMRIPSWFLAQNSRDQSDSFEDACALWRQRNCKHKFLEYLWYV
jgi:hypothetical protein